MEHAAIATKALAIVHLLVGLACSAVALPFISLWLTDPGANASYRAYGAFFLPLFVVYFAPSIIGGAGLLFGARWARRLLLVQAIAYLILIPLGTVLGLATLGMLLGGRRPSGATVDQSGEPLPVPSALLAFWSRPLPGPVSVVAAMAIVGPGFLIAIDLLFHLNEPRTPPELDQAALLALPILLVASLVLIRSMTLSDGMNAPAWTGFDLFHRRQRRWAREARQLRQSEQERIRRLSEDPVLAKYAELIRQGQHWSDAEIAYDQDRARLVTCSHLQPIERAMRDANLVVRPLYGALVAARCCVDGPRLEARFRIATPVWFSNEVPGDRPYDPEGAGIVCTEHGSAIWLIHPREAAADIPWFPQPER